MKAPRDLMTLLIHTITRHKTKQSQTGKDSKKILTILRAPTSTQKNTHRNILKMKEPQTENQLLKNGGKKAMERKMNPVQQAVTESRIWKEKTSFREESAN